MLLSFLIFVLCGALWWATLWFGIAIDFVKWSNLALLAIHILPPVTAWLSWWTWRRHVRRRKANEADEREKKAQAECQTALEEARAQHEQEIQRRRFACDCRAVAICDLAIHRQIELPEYQNVQIQTVPAETKIDEIAQADILKALEPAVTGALRYVYKSCSAAVAFPIYMSPPANVAGTDVFQCVRAIHAGLVTELKLQIKPKDGLPSILFLPSRDSGANSVIAVFENTPDLPGAVVLAFDSPLADAQMVDATDAEEAEQGAPAGKPGHGVFALLVTHPELHTMLNAVADHRDEDEPESLKAFWEKSVPPEGNLALLTLVPKQSRDELRDLSPVARIHRAAVGQTRETPGRVLELECTLKTLLERAQINAGLMEMPFVSGDTDVQPSDKKTEQETGNRCEWLVHNAGDRAPLGSRLASIGNALMHFRIELKPVEMATNMVSQIGGLGRATPIGMLAIALAQTQALQAPALCAEFSEPDGIAVAFIVPVQAD